MQKATISLLGSDPQLNELFVDIFGVVTSVDVPEDLDELHIFREKLEVLLGYAESVDEDVILSRSGKSRIVTSLAEFDFTLDELKSINSIENTDTIDSGNYWAISSEPFVPGDKFNPYDNSDPIITKWDTPMVDPWEPVPVTELPKSDFHRTSELSGGSELRIVDRLAKYGESMPFLNEDGTLSKEAMKDFDELLEAAADQELLAFFKGGLDLAERVGKGAKSALKGAGDLLGVTADGKKAKTEKIKASRELKDAKLKEKVRKQGDKIMQGLETRFDKIMGDVKQISVKKVADGDETEAENYASAQTGLRNLNSAASDLADAGLKGAKGIESKTEKESDKLKDELKKEKEGNGGSSGSSGSSGDGNSGEGNK